MAGFIRGIGDSAGEVVTAAVNTMGKFARTIAKEAVNLADEGAQAIINFLHGVAKVIREREPEIIAAGFDIGKAIVEGAVQGLKDIDLTKVLKGLFKDSLDGVKGLLGIHSPSRVFAEIGKNMMLGTAQGIDNNASAVNDSLDKSTSSMIDQFGKSLSVVPDLLDGIVDLDPTITPVLDLSQVTQQAKQLSDLTAVAPIDTSSAFSQATAIDAAQQTSLQEDAAASASQQPVVFEQNNYSPEALSETEIYRQTKNQLSQAKDFLDKKSA